MKAKSLSQRLSNFSLKGGNTARMQPEPEGLLPMIAKVINQPTSFKKRRWMGSLITGLVAGWLGSAAVAAPVLPTVPWTTGTGSGGLVLVDEIDCTITPAANQFYEEGPDQTTLSGTAPIGTVTQVQTILGSQTRVLPNPVGSAYKYFAYRIGQGKGLVAGKAYVLEVEYPEDASRSMVIENGGEAGASGLFTGNCAGDAVHCPYVNPNTESLDMPLAGTWKTWRSLFHLHDRFTGVVRPKGEYLRPLVPADGFYVTVVHFWNKDEPTSKGAAVRKIRLLEAPSLATYDAGLRLPPDGLPKRHVFSREEMADSTAGLSGTLSSDRGVNNMLDYYEYKARDMKYLGMNTFTKDLLEFASNQGWDNQPGGGNNWYVSSDWPWLWEGIITISGSYGLDVMPYYEYAGSTGATGLGLQCRSHPLAGNSPSYVPNTVSGSKWRVDLSDPDTHADAKKLLDVTMTRYKNKANFVGAWFRARSAQMAISFNDNNILQFSNEVLGGRPISRAQLQTTTSDYNLYLQWFFGKRRAFVDDMRDYLRSQGINKDAVMLYTSDATEPGRHWPSATLMIAETGSNWTNVGESSVTLTQAMAENRHWNALTTPRSQIFGWEWNHADPYNDPANWTGENGSMLTYTFNKAYTVGNPTWLNNFRTQSGLATVHHFALNENTLDSETGFVPVVTNPLGYMVTDMERTGPYCVMGEVLAFANGDPYYMGYLSATTMSRGFAEYVRAFHQAFLALPAVPSTAGTCSNANVVVKNYATDGFGSYVAVANTARTDQNGVVVTLPFQADVTDATTGTLLATSTNSISFDLYPFQLKALSLRVHTATGPQAVVDSGTLSESGTLVINVVNNDTGPGTKTVTSLGTASHGGVSIASGSTVRYVPTPGFTGTDSFRYTVDNGSGTDMARVNVIVQSTQAAGDLSSWGIKDASIGAEDTGDSRLLFGGTTGEVVGFGAGTVGNADIGHFVYKTVAGDFQATVKVNSVSGATSDVLGGMMVRQSEVAGARMVAALVDNTGSLYVRSRNVKTGGTNTVTIDPSMDVAGANVATSGAAWIRIKRAGDLITVEKSSDNITYTEVSWRSMPGLPVSLQVGLWASGGDRYTGARALMESFSVVNTTTGTLFAQDFSSSTNVSSYISASGSANTFGDLSAEIPDGGSWVIDSNGALRLTTTMVTSGSNDAGFTRMVALSATGSVLKFSTLVGIINTDVTNPSSDMAPIDFGTMTTKTDYGSPTSNSSIFAQVMFRGSAANAYRFKLDTSGTYYYNPVDGSAFIGDGRMYQMTVYLSQSGTDQGYYGPDGMNHTLLAGKASLWMNEMAVKENWTRSSSFTAAAPTNFRFSQNGSYGRSYIFDNMMIEARMAAPTPSRSNATPVTVNESGTTAEGTPITLDVLANDSDSDAGPDGLRITAASSASGMAAISAGKLVFTPTPGLTGTASISYTISDGLATANGTATVVVYSTATANNLVTAGGLTGVAIGSGVSGGSRVLVDGYWEVTQTGGAGTATSDKLWWERESVTGDFQVEARIREMQSYGTGAAGGIMIRESTATGSRLVQLSIDPTAVATALGRTALNGTLAQSGSQKALVYPAAWLQLERSGTNITARVSSDGFTFTDLTTVSLSSLASTVDAGLWATNARMIATGFVVRPYQAELMKMDFNSSTSVASYFQELDPEPNQLSDISAETHGGAWSIDTGRLKIVRTTDTSADSAAGFSRTTPWAGPPTALKYSFDLSLLVSNTSNSVQLILFETGSFATPGDYSTGGPQGGDHDSISVFGRGAGLYAFHTNGNNAATMAATGTAVPVIYYVNNTGTSLNYQTPDLTGTAVRVLSSQHISLWVGGTNGTLIYNDEPKPSGGTTPTTNSFRFRMVGPGFTAWIDNFIVSQNLMMTAADVIAPTVAITSPISGSMTTSGTVTLTGTAGDNVGVTSVSGTNNRGGGWTAIGTTAWTGSNVVLYTGTNILTAIARDAAGNSGNSAITVIYNQLPVAPNISGTLSEESSLDINIPTYASDPDAWPQALSVSVGSAGHGGTSVLNGTVTYVPTRGYYGLDSAVYTVSDGIAQTSGTLNYTVTNTAYAMNLLGYKLGGVNVGTGGGGWSRELSTHEMELTGTGASLSGTSDSFHGELKSVVGDFMMAVKVDELVQGAAGARFGLVAREGFAPGARMMGISIGPDSVIRYVVRSASNGSATETVVPGTDPWLVIMKAGNTLSVGTSPTGAAYTTAASVNFAQLASNMQAGLWVAGGSGGGSARGVGSSFMIWQDTMNLAQNFDVTGTSVGVLSDYIDSGTGAAVFGKFNDISAQTNGGTWSIEPVSNAGNLYNGRLKLVRPSSSGTNGAGFTRFSGTLATLQQGLVSCKVSFNGPNVNGDLAYLELAALSGTRDYTLATLNGSMTNQLTFKSSGTNYWLRINGTNSVTTYPSNGTEVQLKWYLNQTGTSVNYMGPTLSGTDVLGAGKSDLWANGVKVLPNFDRSAVYSGTTLTGIRFRTLLSNQLMTVTLEDLDFGPLPPR